MVFSNGFTPTRDKPFLSDAQLVRTMKGAEALSPLLWPVAWMEWEAGCAFLGISTVLVKVPDASAVAEPAAETSNTRFTVSPAENPEPEAVALVEGGPTDGETETAAARAKLAHAPKDRITTNATEEVKFRLMVAYLQSRA
jgi:hypothetical protein